MNTAETILHETRVSRRPALGMAADFGDRVPLLREYSIAWAYEFVQSIRLHKILLGQRYGKVVVRIIKIMLDLISHLSKVALEVLFVFKLPLLFFSVLDESLTAQLFLSTLHVR